MDELAAITAAFRARVDSRVAGRDAGGPRPSGPHVDALASRWQLDPTQADFVVAIVCACVDPLLHPQLVAVAGPDARRGLSVATYAVLVGLGPAGSLALTTWLASGPPATRLGLITPALDGLAPAATPFQASARLIAFLAGADELDPLLARVGGIVTAPSDVHRDDAQQRACARISTLLASRGPGVLVITGPRGVGKRTAVATTRPTVVLEGSRLFAGELDGSVRSLLREARIRDAVPVVADADAILGDPREAGRGLARALDDLPGWAVVTTTGTFDLEVRRRIVRVELTLPEAATRRALWQASLRNAGDEAAVGEVSSRYRLGAGPIVAAAAAATPPFDRASLVDGVRATLATRFGGLAERLVVTDRWDDAVLPADTIDQLHALVARVRHAHRVFDEWRFPRPTARGGGVAALFSGPPGTGKTMLAGVVARELDRDLYRVDLSQIVSKWVGETEKQLAQVFDAAESGDALLLFDEADALFAKRTEVKSSSDRYANLEVNYLLQRVETFGGVTILTTNLDTSIDAALRRRLAAHIVFWPPEHDERVRLWRRFLGTGAPIEGTIDSEELADEFPDMTGANIRNATLSAAFLAAAAGTSIDHELLLRAARAEYRAMGRVLGSKK